jgi:hypothetical protein
MAACGGHQSDVSPQPEDQTTVEVQNQGFNDMVIYALDGTQRIRLGTVTGNSTRTFTIPEHLAGRGGTLRFLADPIGGSRSPVSEEMNVQPGDHVSITIPPQ